MGPSNCQNKQAYTTHTHTHTQLFIIYASPHERKKKNNSYNLTVFIKHICNCMLMAEQKAARKQRDEENNSSTFAHLFKWQMTSLFWESRAGQDVKWRKFERIETALKNQQAHIQPVVGPHCVCLLLLAVLYIFLRWLETILLMCFIFLYWSVVVRDRNSAHAPGARRVSSLFIAQVQDIQIDFLQAAERWI